MGAPRTPMSGSTPYISAKLASEVTTLLTRSQSQAPAADGAPATDLSVATSEFAFDPANEAVAADEDVTVTLDNSGAVEHNWTVLKAGTTIGSESEFTDSMVEATIGDVAAGETLEDVVNLPEGDYQVICSVSSHFDAGMTGELAVGG